MQSTPPEMTAGRRSAGVLTALARLASQTVCEQTIRPSVDAASTDTILATDARMDDAPTEMCRAFEFQVYELCSNECDRCTVTASAGACRAEHDALRSNAECTNNHGFAECSAFGCEGADAGSNCFGRLRIPARGCQCYQACQSLLAPACQPLQRAFDRCVLANCAACRF